MSEPTATNPQTGEKIVFRGGQWMPFSGAPAAAPAPGPVYGAPVKPDAPQQPPSGYRIAATGGLEPIPGGPADPARPKPTDAPSGYRFGPDGKTLELIPGGPAEKQQKFGNEAQGKAGGMLERAIGANNAFEALDVGPRSYIGQKIANQAPDFKNLTDSPTRQQAVAQQRDFISAVLRVESGAAVSQSEFENYSKLFFPQPGDDDTTIQAKAVARRRAMDALKLQAGPAGDSLAIPPAPNAADKNDSTATAATAAAAVPFATFGDGGDEGPPAGQVLVGYGKNADGTPYPLYGPDPKVAAEVAQQDRVMGPAGLGDLAQHGLSLGLTDEGAGVGMAIGRALRGDLNIGDNYRLGRDVEEYRLNEARARTGAGGKAAEIVGGLALPASALGRAATVGEAALGGSIAAGTGGFGYGRGAKQSVGNALIAAPFGAVVGGGGQKIGNALAARSNAPAMAERATTLNEAGQAEGVTVNRAMVDPQSNNRVTKSDATLVGGRRIQRDMTKIEGQVERRVRDLGRGGRPMDDIGLGDTAHDAGRRFIDRSGQSAARKYDRAEKLAGNAAVEPKESLRRVDEMISTLSETPGQNSAELGFLNTLKDDLSKNLSVGALRRMRTSLRQRIRTGGLTFGEDESRVLSIMDGAADDIRAGLTAQGKPEAARAFDAADKSYRARMEYISGTVQKLIGKRGANLPSEQIARRVQSMAGNDARGLRKFYATLDPSEQADVAATFADQLGKNNKGDFSVAHFLSQTEKMSDQAVQTIFGPQGAQSVKNLRTLGKEVARVTGAMNSRTSKSGVASYRDWLFSLISGGGVGAVGSGGNLATTGGAAVAGAVVKGAHDAISANALMSPKISKWLLQAPSTQSPAAINAHFARLGEIAKAEPALTGEIDALRRAIMGAANDNATKMTSAARDEDARKRK